MSAFVVMRLEDRIVVLSDGATYPGYHDFTMTGSISKTYQFPHLSTIMVWRGTQSLVGLLYFKFAHRWNSFDEIIQMIPEHAGEAIGYFHNLWPEAAGAAEIAICGWSNTRSRFETYSFLMDTTVQYQQDPKAIPSVYMAPEPDRDRLVANGLVKDGKVTVTNDADLRMLIQSQRETAHYMGHPGDDADTAAKGYCVGGFIEELTLTSDAITAKIVQRWPHEMRKAH